MYDTLYAILNKSENATLQYFIFCEKVVDEKYLQKLDNVFLISSSGNSTNLSLLMSELCSFLRLKLYSLNCGCAKKDCYAYQNSSYLCCIDT